MDIKDRLIVALDTPNRKQALALVNDLKDLVGMFKVGSILFTACGPQIVRDIIKTGSKVMLDLKYHDTENTLGKSVCEAAKLGPEFMTVDSSSGHKNLKAAVDNKGDSKILAVTVLTSMSNDECFKIHRESPKNVLFVFALQAMDVGADGVVCAATIDEVSQIKEDYRFHNLITVCPGIRLANEKPRGQIRMVTPNQALARGADYIVVGKPITEPLNPELTPVTATLEILNLMNESEQWT